MLRNAAGETPPVKCGIPFCYELVRDGKMKSKEDKQTELKDVSCRVFMTTSQRESFHTVFQLQFMHMRYKTYSLFTQLRNLVFFRFFSKFFPLDFLQILIFPIFNR